MKREVKLTTPETDDKFKAFECMMSDKPNSNAVKRRGKWVNRK